MYISHSHCYVAYSFSSPKCSYLPHDSALLHVFRYACYKSLWNFLTAIYASFSMILHFPMLSGYRVHIALLL